MVRSAEHPGVPQAPEQESERVWRDEWAGFARGLDQARRAPWLFGLSILCVAALALLWQGQNAPHYVSQARVIVPKGAGTLQDGAAVWEAHDRDSALPWLHSEEVLREVVLGPPNQPHEWPLTTLVQRAAAPLPKRLAFWAEPPRGTLRARLEGEEPQAKHDWSVWFEDDRTAWAAPTPTLSSWSMALGLAWGSSAQRIALDPDGLLHGPGVQLHLHAEGALAGQAFRIIARDVPAAIRDVRARLKASTPRSAEQTLELRAQDTQPAMATEIARRWCEAWIQVTHRQRAGRLQAQSALLEDQIADRKRRIDAVEESVSQVQTQHPELLQPETSLALAAEAVHQAEQRLQDGEDRLAALQDIAEGIAALDREALAQAQRVLASEHLSRWLAVWDELEEESHGRGRPERQVQQIEYETRWHTALAEWQREQQRYLQFREHLEAFRQGEDGRLTALLELVREPGQPDLAGLLETEIKPYRAAQTRWQQETTRYTEQHPAALAAAQTLASRREALLLALEAQRIVWHDALPLLRQQADDWRALAQRDPRGESQDPTETRTWLQTKLTETVAAEIDGLRREAQRWSRRRDQWLARWRAIPAAQQTLRGPLLESAAWRDQLRQLLAQSERVAMAAAALEQHPQALARVLAPASPGQREQPYLRHLVAGVGALCGGLLALLIAQSRAHRPRKQARTSPSDAMRAPLPSSDLPVLAHLPQQGESPSTMREAMRKLRIRLDATKTGGFTTTLLGVTGLIHAREDEEPAQWEGRGAEQGTFPTPQANLVRGLAQEFQTTGRSVLVVDACGDLSRDLGRERSPGLRECLLGNTWWRACLIGLPETRLSCLPLGTQGQSTHALFASLGWEPMLREMAEAFDGVLVHLPNCDEHPEVGDVAAHLDGVVLVVPAEAQNQPWAFGQALRGLRQSGTQLLGQVQWTVSRAEPLRRASA